MSSSIGKVVVQSMLSTRFLHVPDPEMVRWVEDAMDSLDQGHSSRRVAAWLVEKTNQKNLAPRHNQNLGTSSWQRYYKAFKAY